MIVHIEGIPAIKNRIYITYIVLYAYNIYTVYIIYTVLRS